MMVRSLKIGINGVGVGVLVATMGVAIAQTAPAGSAPLPTNLGLSAEELARLQRESTLVSPPPAASVEESPTNAAGVVIRRYYDGSVEEYRLNGEVYEIKVNPTNAPSPYYLLNPGGQVGDVEGSGRSRNDNDRKLIPGWRLLNW